MSTQLDKYRYEPGNSREAIELAKWIKASQLAPSGLSAQDIYLVMAAGAEYGWSTMQSLRCLYVIKGRVCMYADTIVGLVKASEACVYFRLVESSAELAHYETQRQGAPEPEAMRYSVEDSKRAGLWGNGQWKKYPADMLRARCASRLARAVYPDVVGGIYDPDELREAIDVTPAPRAEAKQIKAGIDVAGICAAKEDALLCADWTPKDLEAFISAWKIEIQAWKPLLMSLISAGAIRAKMERADITKALLEHGKWERFDMSEADLAAAWCALVCPSNDAPKQQPPAQIEIDPRLEELVHTPQALRLRKIGIRTYDDLGEQLAYRADEIEAQLGDDVFKHVCRVFGFGDEMDYLDSVKRWAQSALEMAPHDTVRRQELLIDQVCQVAGQQLKCSAQAARGHIQTQAGNVRLEDMATLEELARVWRRTVETRRAAA